MTIPDWTALTGSLCVILAACSCTKTEDRERTTTEEPPPGGNWIAETIVEPPKYNDRAGGWESEQVAGAVGEHLKKLAKAIDSDEGWDEVAGWLSDDLSAQSLVVPPEKLVSAYETDSVAIQRLIDPATVPANDGKAFVSALKSLGGTRKRTQFKVVGITQEGDHWATSLVSHHTANHGGASTQWNSRWSAKWMENDETLTLVSLQMLEGESVSVKSAGSGFADCTAAVFDGVESFSKQLTPSVDHWLGLVDMRLGMDVGGWQGVAIGDVNGDGLEDLYACQPGGLPNRLFAQKADGTLKDISKGSGVDWLESTHGALFVDTDNDGDQDLLVGLPDGVACMRNDGKGVFTIRAMEIIPGGTPYSLAAADYDVDGDVDIFVCCYNTRFRDEAHLVFARPVPYHDANNGGKNALLQNDGRGSFRHVTVRTGLDENNQRFSYAASWEDFDNDGDLDLYVANDFGRNNLYRNDTGNDGFVKFRDAAVELHAEDIGPGMSVAWGDWNNDGFSDLYVSNMFSSAGNRIATQQQFLPGADDETKSSFLRHARGNTLLSNDKGRAFTDATLSAGVNVGRWAWGSLFADFNNDGWQDIAVANGFITQQDSGDL